jgi:hypothetical protein
VSRSHDIYQSQPEIVLLQVMIDETPTLSRAGFASPGGRATAKTDTRGLELLIGSNIFRNTNGVIKVQGKEQLVLEFRPEQGLLLVTMDLYSENGIHVAHLRRNVFVLNRSEQFAAEIHRSQCEAQVDHPWVRLLDRRSGLPVLETQVVSENRAHILSGKFYSHQGAPVEITPHYCRIGAGTTLFGEIVESRGGMVSLGSELSRPFPARP